SSDLCAGRDDQRFVQNGSDSPQGTLENQGRRGAGHPGMGILVQPSTLAGIDRRHPAGRGRRKVPSSTCSTGCGTCFTLTKQPPRFPVRFTSALLPLDEFFAKTSLANVDRPPFMM